MITKEKYNKAFNILLCAFIIFNILPIKINYGNGPLILLIILAAYDAFSGINKKAYNYSVLVLVFPLLIYILGMLNSENLSYGTRHIFRNIYFLAFPLLFFNKNKEDINVNLIYKAFLISLSIVNLYLIYLFVYYFNIGERFYKIVTEDIYHSTYLGMYNLFAFWIVMLNNKPIFNRKYKPFILLFFIVCAVFTSSRIIFILSILSLIFSAFMYFKLKARFLISLVAIIGVTSFLVLEIPSINEKFMQILEVKNFTFNKTNYLSISSRLAKIEAASTVIKENIVFGTGTGDIIDELVKVYKEMNFTMGYKYRYNPHNQFLDNIARNGILLGTIALVSIYIWPLILSLRKKNKILFAFGLVIIGVSLTESILNVQRGIAFCAFFLSLLVFNVISKPRSNNV